MAELIVVHETRGATAIVHVFDEVDIANAPHLGTEVERASRAARIVLELSRCLYMDSSGVRILVKAFREYGERLRIVVRDGSSIDTLLRVLKLKTLLPVVDSLDRAIAAASGDRSKASNGGAP